jgi:hypothetical protein
MMRQEATLLKKKHAEEVEARVRNKDCSYNESIRYDIYDNFRL